MKKKLLKIFCSLDLIVGSVLLIVLVALTLWGVFMRYFMQNPLKWTEEVSLGLFVWCIFLGTSVAIRTNMHISISFIVDLFPKKVQRYIDILVIILSYVIFIALLILGIQFSKQAMLKITPALRLPYTIIAISMPISAVFMLISHTTRQMRTKFGLIEVDDDEEIDDSGEQQ